MTLIVLGPQGTFSHEMAEKIHSGEILLVETIGKVFAEVMKTGFSGLVPLENS